VGKFGSAYAVLFHWTHSFPGGVPKRRGFHLRVCRIGMALSWDGRGMFHKTNWVARQVTWNRGPIRWTIFWVDDYNLWLETI
jgi:hypothetical protein